MKAVLLDVDGTLLDSNAAHARAWADVLQRRGHAVTHDAVRPLIGMGGDKLLAQLLGIDAESDEGRQINAERARLFVRHHLPSLRPTRGARALLERFVADGLMLVVATSAQGDELKGLLEQAGIADLIHRSATSNDAQESKPDPDIVDAALGKAGLGAGDALMLGDTPHDVKAARTAGVATVALRCGGWWGDDALRGAEAIYDDPADLLARIAESPFGT